MVLRPGRRSRHGGLDFVLVEYTKGEWALPPTVPAFYDHVSLGYTLIPRREAAPPSDGSVGPSVWSEALFPALLRCRAVAAPSLEAGVTCSFLAWSDHGLALDPRCEFYCLCQRLRSILTSPLALRDVRPGRETFNAFHMCLAEL